jgi:hypothetical protein
MAGPVKGTIGNEEVVLNDAATETTLLKLLAAVQKGGAGGGGAGGGGAKEAQQNLMNMAQQTGKTSKELEEFEEVVEETGNALTRGFGHVFQGMQNVALEFMGGSTRLSEFSSHITGVISNIPIIGGALGGTLQLLTSVLDNAVDSFRELSAVGVDFGGGLMENRLMASRAGISLEAFSEVVTNNSESFALLGGSASAGARVFTRLSGEVQKNQSRFSKLGLTMEDTAAFTADYLEMQTRLGRSQRMSNREMAAGATNLVLEIDKLAKVTGKRRDQVAAQLKSNMEDKRLKLLFNTMDEAAQANLNGVLTMMDSASPDLKDAITEMVATGGVPLGAMGQDLIRLNPRLGEMAEGLKNGTVTQDQFMEEIRKTANMADNLSDEQKAQYSTLAAMGSEMGAAIIEIIGLKNAGKGLKEVTEEQAAAQEKRDRAMLDFESGVQKMKNAIMDVVIESGVFDAMQNAISALVGDGSEGGMKGLTNAIKPIADWFKSFFSELSTAENPMDVIKTYLSDGLSKLGEMITPLISSAFSGIGSAIMGAIFGGGGDKKDQNVPGPDGATNNEGGDASTGGMFSGIGDKLLGFVKLIGVGGAIYVGFKVFQKLLSGFANPKVAIGVGVFTTLLIGTGAAIMLAGKGIELAGEGVQKMADGLDQMSQIKDAAKLKDVAGALGDMGTAMLALGAGNVLDSITSFFGASSPFEKMVEGINEFTGVDPAALASMTSSAGALAGLKSFADDIDSSNVTKFAESIENLAESMEDLNDAYSNSTGFFGKNAPGSQEILNAISTGSSQGSQGVNSSIGRLVALMEENNTLTKRILDATGDGV